MQTKTCCKCRTEKPIDGFSKNSSRKDGLAAECKDCTKARDDARRNSPEGKAYLHEYNRSESAKKAQAKHQSKPETKARVAAHNANPEVVARKAAHAKKQASIDQQRSYNTSIAAKWV